MSVVQHHILCPFSRQLRIILLEKNISFTLKSVNFWEEQNSCGTLMLGCDFPILVNKDGLKIAGIYPLIEYLEETAPAVNLIGHSIEDKANIRQQITWFNNKFYLEITQVIIKERIVNFYTKGGEPNSKALRAAKTMLHYQMSDLEEITTREKWLAGATMSLSDIAASAQISLLDYLGDISWDKYPATKEWYAIIKSRPSFRSILNERIPGFLPSKDYSNLDF
jgi:glutathione S-transferase